MTREIGSDALRYLDKLAVSVVGSSIDLEVFRRNEADSEKLELSEIFDWNLLHFVRDSC